VSAALTVEVSAKAGVANKIVARLIPAADHAARHNSAHGISPADYDFTNRISGVVAGCDGSAAI
jgi:hypothetical protein